MSPEEAEARIVEVVRQIDATRELLDISDEKKNALVAEKEREILELKKFTGPRHVTGTFSPGG